MAPLSVLLGVGDVSGDLHAARLMRAMRRLEPDVRFVGLGMTRMAEEGLHELSADWERGSAMWMHNVARLNRHHRRLMTCCDYIDREGVDLVLPMDFGGFNLYLSREGTRRGLPVFYYIPPQVWAHAAYRLKKLRRWVTLAGLIYPFEPPLYERYGVPARFIGHPLFDEIAENPPSPAAVERLRARFGAQLVGLFPGSRLQEVRAHMPMLEAACRMIRTAVPDAAFVLRCPPALRAMAAALIRDERLIVLVDDVTPLELARAARICLTKSGTITLEIASQGTPMVVFYRCTPFLLFIAYGIASSPWVTLVNTLAGREVCAEKVMRRDEPDWLARQGLRLLQDAEAYEACRRGMAEALSGFAVPGASVRAAETALSLL
ncbi:MAG: lipid-A-disaccharide synthase [Candidatus Brocadiaceae bacterium]|nr:lipid-A-disaccharide synthase [Candidatus Brocadiaceae bacterium]